MEVVKAEILWSRKCNLKCSYCNMANNKNNTPTLEQWQEGVKQLQKLDCSFLAFYGAEPLLEFDKLPALIYFARLIGIDVTVITSGIVMELVNKLRTLYDFGLRSLTTSYDMTKCLDSSSQTKSYRALQTLDVFRSFGDTDNVAVVATLTKQNFKFLPYTIKALSDKKIWTFFDLIHADRGQPGSKVKNTGLDLMFTKDDFKELADVLHEVILLKKQGYLCHASEIFLNMIIAQQNDVYTWQCAKEREFPAWVTIDCDGTLMPCDDFNIFESFKIWNIYNEWDAFCEVQKNAVLGHCPGCCWGTHIDACAIKGDRLPLTDYIHK